MLNNHSLHTKTFSKIDNLQDYCEISYNICEKQDAYGKSFGIEITTKTENHISKKLIENVSYSEKLVSNIITYLFENSVKEEQAGDIIKDILHSLTDLS